MTIETARMIVSKCLAHVWYREGISEEPGPPIQDLSLAELVEANKLVADDPGEKQSDGSTRHMIHCDDRLVAALYVATHYLPDDPEDIRPLAVIGRAAACCIKLPAKEDE